MSFKYQPNPLLQPPPELLRTSYPPDKDCVLKTTCAIKTGQVVMVDTPVVVYPSSLSCLSTFCSHCFRILPAGPLQCPKCHGAYFCSYQCLARSHPPLLCRALSTTVSDTRTWSDDFLFLLSVYSLSDIKLAGMLDSVNSNLTLPDESVKKLHSEINSLLPADKLLVFFTPKNTSVLMFMKKNNSLPLKIPKDPVYQVAGPRAYGLYLWASMINHDCIPNVCRFDYVDVPSRGRNADIVFRVVFRAMHDIKENMEIYTSYVDVAKGYKERNNSLIENFRLKCECVRCNVESQQNENKVEKEESEDKKEEKGEDQTMVEGGDNNIHKLIHKYLEKYICDCGGIRGPTQPKQDGTQPDFMECNVCGRYDDYKAGDPLTGLY